MCPKNTLKDLLIVIKKRITGLANVSLLCSILYIFLKALEQNMEPTKRKAFDPMWSILYIICKPVGVCMLSALNRKKKHYSDCFKTEEEQ